MYDPESVADMIGLAAVIIQDLSARRVKDYSFEWSRITSFEGDTGPYLQFTHARLCSLEKKCAAAGIHVNNTSYSANIVDAEAQEIIMSCAKLPSVVVQNALVQQEPCYLVKYLMEICQVVSSSLEKLRVIGKETSVAESRFLVFQCARITIGNALLLLGIKPVEAM